MQRGLGLKATDSSCAISERWDLHGSVWFLLNQELQSQSGALIISLQFTSQEPLPVCSEGELHDVTKYDVTGKF